MINLLPPQYKKEFLKEENQRLFLILEILILTFFLSLALILFSIKIHISGQVESQKILVDLEKKELSQIKNLEEKFNLVNQGLAELDSFYQNQFRLTDFLERVANVLPKGIYLTSFSYQKDTSQVALSGFSPTVEALVDLKNNLEKQKDFKEVHFPSAVWVKLVNINFTVTFSIAHDSK